jgi:hypothetical protein
MTEIATGINYPAASYRGYNTSPINGEGIRGNPDAKHRGILLIKNYGEMSERPKEHDWKSCVR